MKLEVGKTYIDSYDQTLECVLERNGWFYCCFQELSKDLRAFGPEGDRLGDPSWYIVKEKPEDKIWLNVYKFENDKHPLCQFVTKHKSKKAADDANHASYLKRIDCYCVVSETDIQTV